MPVLRRLLWLQLWLALLVLGGCASTPVAPLQKRAAEAAQSPFAFNGRVATRHEGERSSAGVRWTHRGGEDEILLLAPLGRTVARIHGDANGVELQTSNGYYTAHDAEALTEQVLGWHLPMAGMRYWVLGLPAPDTPADIERAANGQVSLMHQNGWEIRYLRYALETPDSLPLRLSLQRNGMEIQLFIDEWETQP
jgi:outer membrane lipoprotein LolB